MNQVLMAVPFLAVPVGIAAGLVAARDKPAGPFLALAPSLIALAVPAPIIGAVSGSLMVKGLSKMHTAPHLGLGAMTFGAGLAAAGVALGYGFTTIFQED